MSKLSPRRAVVGVVLVGALGALGATSLVTSAGDGRTAPVVCTSHAVLAPTTVLEPYGEVHVVDAAEAEALARGCAHAGRYELTPACELWHTEARPEVVERLDATTCAAVTRSTR